MRLFPTLPKFLVGEAVATAGARQATTGEWVGRKTEGHAVFFLRNALDQK